MARDNFGQLCRLSAYWKGKLLDYFSLGVPAYRLRFKTPYSLPTIERFFRIIRWAIYQQGLTETHPLNGSLEMDETMFGGRRKGRRGWGAGGKVIAFGIYQRNGHVKVFPVPNRKHQTLTSLIINHTKPGGLYYTDDYHAYTFLSIRGNHVVVEKEKGQPKGRDHLNGLEGFWSYAKHFLYHYRGVPKTYFHLYLKEVEFRFNHRDKDLLPLLRGLMNQSVKVQVT